MTIQVVNTYGLKDDTPTEVLERYDVALHELVEDIRNGQPDTWSYTVMRDTTNPLSFVHYAIYKDKEARSVHRHDPSIERTKSIIKGHLKDGFKATVCDLVASQSVLNKPSNPAANSEAIDAAEQDEPY